MTEEVMDIQLIKELVEKLADKDEQIAMLREDKKKIIDDYTQRTGVPGKKEINAALTLAKKRVDQDTVETLMRIIEPLVGD